MMTTKNVDSNLPPNTNNESKRRRVSSLSSLSYRLKNRRLFHLKRKLIAEFSLGFALIGIIMMIIGIELDFANKPFSYIMIFHIITTLSTICLLFLIVAYYITDLQLFLVDNCLHNFMLGVSVRRTVYFSIEILICAIHPIDYLIGKRIEFVTFGRVLGLLMFLRLYLMVRIFVLHSWINKHSWAQGLSNFNHINLNFKFVMKSVMNQYPVRTVSVMVAILLVWGCWAVHVCEMSATNGVNKLSESMWLVAITFLGVGYGDIVPLTICGRVSAVLTGLFGAAITALTVAILARKLELTKSESHVHYFVISSELNKELKSAAARIIRRAWDLYRQRVKNRVKREKQNLPCRLFCCDCCENELEVYYERRLLEGICTIRELRRRINRLREESFEINPRQTLPRWRNNSTSLSHSNISSGDFGDRLDSIENSINDIKRCLKKLTNEK